MFPKHSTFIFLLYLITSSINATIIYPDNLQILNFTQKPVIIFDADQVLLDRLSIEEIFIISYMEILLDSHDPNRLLHYIPIILNIEKSEMPNALTITQAFDTLCKETNQGIINYDMDPLFDDLVSKHPVLQETTKSNISLAKCLKKNGSIGTPIQETINILLQLHNQQFPIAIATNQGSSTFKQLINAKTVPNETLYELIYTCDYSIEGTITLSSEFIKKPSSEYFVRLIKALDERNLESRALIFIDDRLENIEAAAQEGIIGIHFENAQQLTDDLAKLGITIS